MIAAAARDQESPQLSVPSLNQPFLQHYRGFVTLKEGFQLFFVLSFNVVSMTSRLTDGPLPVSRLLPCPRIGHLLARIGGTFYFFP